MDETNDERVGELERVRNFLRRVDAQSSQQDHALAVARLTIADLERQLRESNERLARRNSELERLRQKYEASITNTGERIAEMTEQLLHDKLAGQIDDMRTQLVAQYDSRVTALKEALVEGQVAAEQARKEQQQLTQDLEEARRTAASTLEQSLQVQKQNFERQLAQVEQRSIEDRELLRSSLRALQEQGEHSSKQMEVAIAEKDKLLEAANQTVLMLQQEAERLRLAADTDLDTLRRTRLAEKESLETSLMRLQAHNHELETSLSGLEAIIQDDEKLQRLQQFEAELVDLRASNQEREGLIAELFESLAVIREVCAKSPAARSIIGGSAGSALKLERLFSLLDDWTVEEEDDEDTD